MVKTEKLIGYLAFKSSVNTDETGWPDTLEAFFDTGHSHADFDRIVGDFASKLKHYLKTGEQK